MCCAAINFRCSLYYSYNTRASSVYTAKLSRFTRIGARLYFWVKSHLEVDLIASMKCDLVRLVIFTRNLSYLPKLSSIHTLPSSPLAYSHLYGHRSKCMQFMYINNFWCNFKEVYGS